MSYSLNSLKGVHIGDDIGTTIGVIRGNASRFYSSSYLDMYMYCLQDERKLIGYILPASFLVELSQNYDCSYVGFYIT